MSEDSDNHRRILDSGDDLQRAGAVRAATMLPIPSAIAVAVIVDPNRSTFFSNGSAKCSSGVSLGLIIRTSASLLLIGKSGLASFKNLAFRADCPSNGYSGSSRFLADGDQGQIAPLTARARAILDEIAADKRRGAIVANSAKLIFTRDDGRRISRSMISRAVEQAAKKTGVKKLVFHNYHNTALTEWSRRGIDVDVAMRASGHTSIVMHKRYIDLKDEDIAAAFGTGPFEMVDRDGRQKASGGGRFTVSG